MIKERGLAQTQFPSAVKVDEVVPVLIVSDIGGIVQQETIPATQGKGHIQDRQPSSRRLGRLTEKLPVLGRKDGLPNHLEPRMHRLHVRREEPVRELLRRQVIRVDIVHKRDTQIIEVVTHRRDGDIVLLLQVLLLFETQSLEIPVEHATTVLSFVLQLLHPGHLGVFPKVPGRSRPVAAVQVLFDQVDGVERPGRRAGAVR